MRGGSIRIPAACTGTVGIKATLGLVPNEVAPDGFGNFSNTGPMARTVLDTALMLDAMAGAHPGDPHSLGLARGEYAAGARAGGDLRGCRIACFSRLGNQAVDGEVMAAFEAAAGTFRDLGASVEPVEETFANTEPYWLVISQSLWAARFEHYLPDWESRMTPTLVRGIKEGQTYLAADLQRATLFRSELFRRVQGWFGRFDLVLTPDHQPHRAADRPRLLRAHRDRGPARRLGAHRVVPVHASVQHDGPPRAERSLRVGPRRPADGPPDRGPHDGRRRRAARRRPVRRGAALGPSPAPGPWPRLTARERGTEAIQRPRDERAGSDASMSITRRGRWPAPGAPEPERGSAARHRLRAGLRRALDWRARRRWISRGMAARIPSPAKAATMWGAASPSVPSPASASPPTQPEYT